MTLPRPEPGLVIRYAYLWADQAITGREEGAKDRPCAIVAARRVHEGQEIVTVVPITHTQPLDPSSAVELPSAIKAHLGLDSLPSWVALTETNDFVWPGPDLRPVSTRGVRRFSYGLLPPRFFIHIRDRLLAAHAAGQLRRTRRSV